MMDYPDEEYVTVRGRFDALALVAVAFLGFLAAVALRDIGVIKTHPFAKSDQANVSSAFAASQDVSLSSVQGSQNAAPPMDIGDPDIVASPYDSYFVTQGPHGFDYGHMAIDLSAGKGAPIKSPINGVISEFYVDQYENTTLVIENDHYQVTLLHGIYTVNIGDQVTIGQVIGSESNQGLTYDPSGRLCRGRDCGYHSHLNIFDKRIGANVDPMELISP